jgi:hypothetical protein
MSRKFRIGMITLLVVGALTVVMAGTALAQEETPAPAPEAEGWFGRGHGFGMPRGMGGQVGLEAAAELLGMTADELSAQLWGGETLANLAEEAGVDLQDIQDAVTAANETAKREAIEQAVEDEVITREHADWLLEGLDKGYLSERGFRGFGGRGGFGGFKGSGMLGGFQNLMPSTNNSNA